MVDETKAAELQKQALAVLGDLGFDEAELIPLWNGHKELSLRDHRLQLLIRDATLWREAQAKARAAAVKPVPPVQRPGAATSRHGRSARPAPHPTARTDRLAPRRRGTRPRAPRGGPVTHGLSWPGSTRPSTSRGCTQEGVDARVMCGWPPGCKGFFACWARAVNCGHVSGLLSRRKAAGPDGTGVGSRPDQARGVELPHNPGQVALDLSVDRHCHHAPSPSQALRADRHWSSHRVVPPWHAIPCGCFFVRP